MRKIFLSAGHDNSAPGAVANGFTEAQIVTEFRNLVLFYIPQAGSDGTGSVNLPLREAVKAFKPSDFALEFHLNAAASPTATGVETLSAPKDYAFCKKLTSLVASTLGITDRGAKPENSGQHSRLAFVQAGGIIVELFFLTNKTDLGKYFAKKEVLAKEVAKLIVEHANAQ